MEIPEMTTKVSPLLGATGVEDPGRVDGVGTGRPDPEVPARARRRTFAAQYKLDIVAEYDAAPDGEKGVVLRREGCIPATSSSGAGPVTRVRWPG
jgi:transposase